MFFFTLKPLLELLVYAILPLLGSRVYHVSKAMELELVDPMTELGSRMDQFLDAQGRGVVPVSKGRETQPGFGLGGDNSDNIPTTSNNHRDP